MAVWDDYTWIVVTGCLAAFFTAYGIGANDVANAFGSSIAARTLTMRQALLIASVCEFSGSVLLGGEVTRTVASGIASLAAFERSPEMYMYGMLCALVSSGTWLLLATYLELPVSTTHSIAGAVLGFAFVYGGHKAVVWLQPQDEFPYMRGMVPIVVSWFVSPLLSGLATALLFFIVRTAILRRDQSLELAFWALPVLVLFTVFINVYFVLYKGADTRIVWTSGKCAWVSACAAGGCTLLMVFIGMPLVRKYVYRDIAARRRQQLADVDAQVGRVSGGPSRAGGGGSANAAAAICRVSGAPSAGGSGYPLANITRSTRSFGGAGLEYGLSAGGGSGAAAAVAAVTAAPASSFVEYRAPAAATAAALAIPPPAGRSLGHGWASSSPPQQQQQAPSRAHSSHGSLTRMPLSGSAGGFPLQQESPPLPLPLPPPSPPPLQQQQLERWYPMAAAARGGSPPPPPVPEVGDEDGSEGAAPSPRRLEAAPPPARARSFKSGSDAAKSSGSNCTECSTGAAVVVQMDGEQQQGPSQAEEEDGEQAPQRAEEHPPADGRDIEQHLPQPLQRHPLQQASEPPLPLHLQQEQLQVLQQQQWLRQQQQWMLQQQQWMLQHQQQQQQQQQNWMRQQQGYLQAQGVRQGPIEQLQLPLHMQQNWQAQQNSMQQPWYQQQQQQQPQFFLQDLSHVGGQSSYQQQQWGPWPVAAAGRGRHPAAAGGGQYDTSPSMYGSGAAGHGGRGMGNGGQLRQLAPPGPVAEALEWDRKSAAPTEGETPYDKDTAGSCDAATAGGGGQGGGHAQWQNTFDQLKAIVLHGTNVNVHDVILTDAAAQRIHEHAEVFDPATEDAFKYLQVITAICDSFSHGANDVANSVGPLTAIWYIFRFQRIDYMAGMPIWILVLGGAGIVVGLATYGYNIIRAIGVRLSAITPSRGFCIELSTAVVVAVASTFGLPVSTTHCQVGATAGMGLMEGSSGLNWLLAAQFFTGWVVTLLLTGLMSAALFAAGAYAPCVQQGRQLQRYEDALLDLTSRIDLLLIRSNFAARADPATWGNFSAALNQTVTAGLQAVQLYGQGGSSNAMRPVQNIDPAALLDLVNNTVFSYYNNSLPFIGGMAAKGLALPRRP